MVFPLYFDFMLRFLFSILASIAVLAGCKANSIEVRPLRYADIDVVAVFDEKQPVESITKWLVEFAPSSSSERIFVLPGGGQTFNRYADVSASLVRDGQLLLALQVEMSVHQLRGLNGERYSIIKPVVKLPATGINDRVEISFRISQKEHEAITWLPDSKVSAARVKVKARGSAPLIGSFGFESFQHERSGEWNVETFVMRKDMGDPKDRSGESAPFVVATAFRHWPDVWQAEALEFRRELEKPLSLSDITFFDQYRLGRTGGRSIEEKQKISKEIYGWLVREFAYRAAGLDPTYSTIPRPIEETWRRRTGDCKDLSLVYIKLLQNVGIDAEPVLVPIANDRNLPRKSNVPTMLLFNHLIVYIPELKEYVDLTAGSADESGAFSSAYARGFGGHMFSGEYRVMMPQKSQSNIKVSTVIKKFHGQWEGITTWRGAGLGQLKVQSAQKTLRSRMTGADGSAFLKNYAIKIVPQSWRESEDTFRGISTSSFSFYLNNPPVDRTKRLVYMPKAFYAGNLLKYDTKSELDKVVVSPCYRIENSTELLEIEGVSSADVEGIAQVSIKRQGFSFLQKMEIVNDTFRLERHLDIDERRVMCSERDADEQRAFFAEVRSVVEAIPKKFDSGSR